MNIESDKPVVVALDRPRITACVTAADAQALADFRTECKRRERVILDYFDPQVKQAHTLHKSLVKQRDEACRPFREAVAWAEPMLRDYARREQERVRAEREAIEAQARADAAEQARAAAAEAADIGAASVADQLTAEAREIESGARAVAAPEAAFVAAPKIRGLNVRHIWRAECTNLRALVEAVAADRAPLQLLAFAQASGNEWAAINKGVQKLPGVRVTCDGHEVVDGQVIESERGGEVGSGGGEIEF